MYGIFTYIYYKNQPFMSGKYTSPMDPMGYDTQQFLKLNLTKFQSQR